VSTIVKAAAVQISPVLYSQQGTVERIVKKICELSHQGVQFATFPEAVVPLLPLLRLRAARVCDGEGASASAGTVGHHPVRRDESEPPARMLRSCTRLSTRIGTSRF
jgi:hypothetical protein